MKKKIFSGFIASCIALSLILTPVLVHATTSMPGNGGGGPCAHNWLPVLGTNDEGEPAIVYFNCEFCNARKLIKH